MPDGIQMRLVRDNSAAWSARLRARVATELRDSAERTRASAEAAAPKRTGDLAASGRVVERSELEYAVRFGDGLPDGRAIYQELGTSQMAAQPYLYPSFMAEFSNLVRRLAITTQGRVKIAPTGPGLSGSPEIS